MTSSVHGPIARVGPPWPCLLLAARQHRAPGRPSSSALHAAACRPDLAPRFTDSGRLGGSPRGSECAFSAAFTLRVREPMAVSDTDGGRHGRLLLAHRTAVAGLLVGLAACAPVTRDQPRALPRTSESMD